MIRLLVAAAGLLLVLTGCAKQIDDAKAEAFIAKTVSDEIGVRVESVKCPGGLVAKQGDSFQCTVTGRDGSSAKIKVTERDDQGHVALVAPLLRVRDVEASIRQYIGRQSGGDVRVACPEVVVGAKGKTFDCKATAGEDRATVKVTQTDAEGRLTYKVGGR